MIHFSHSTPWRKKGRVRPALLVLALAAVGIALLFPEGRALAQSAPDKVAIFFIEHFLYPIIQFLANLLIVFFNILVAVAQYNDFINAPAVEKGWVIIRDLCNMFFIVILLVIAFGTIFNLDGYRYNRILGKLVIFAFLINFSKFVAGFWIDLGQVVMLTFVNGFKDAAAGNLASGLGLSATLQLSENANANDVLDITTKAVYGAVILAIILLGIAAVVTLIITALLIYRIIWLWILIVISPLAFLLRIFPNTTTYSDQWWREFNKNVIVGPVLAFFLWLSLTVIATNNGDLATDFASVSKEERAGLLGVPDERGEGVGLKINAAITSIGESDRLLSYMITIGLLLASLQMAQQLGAAGGKWAGTWGDKLKKGGLAAGGVLSGVAAARLALRGGQAGGKMGAQFAHRKLVEKVKIGKHQPLAVTTGAYWRGIAKRGEEKKREFDTLMEGRGRQKASIAANRWNPWGNSRAVGRYDEEAFNSLTIQKAADMEKTLGRNPSTDKVVDVMLTASEAGGDSGLAQKAAALIRGAQGINIDDLNQAMVTKEVREAARDVDGNILDTEKRRIMNKYGLSVDLGDDWEKDFRQETAKHQKAFLMSYMGLNTEKYDPNTIAQKKAGGRNALNTLKKTNPEKYNQIMTSSENEARQAAREANIDDARRLNTIERVGVIAQERGQHLEQRHGGYDTESGNAFIMSDRQATDLLRSEMQKTPVQDIISRISPHVFNARYLADEKTGRWDVNTNAEDWSDMAKHLFNSIAALTQRDAGRLPPRIPNEILGVQGEVGEDNVIFNKDGSLYEGTGTSEERAKRKDQSMARWQALLSVNETTAKKLWGFKFAGSVDSYKKVPVTKEGLSPENVAKIVGEANEKKDGESSEGEKSKETGVKSNETKSPGGIILNAGAQFKLQQEGGTVTPENTARTSSSESSSPDVIESASEGRAPYNASDHNAADSYERFAGGLKAYQDNPPNTENDFAIAVREFERNATDAINRLADIERSVSRPDLKNDIQQVVEKLRKHQEDGKGFDYQGSGRDAQKDYFRKATEMINESAKVIRQSVKEK